MSKGGWANPGKVLSVRVNLALYDALKQRAEEKRVSISDYLKGCLEYMVRRATVDSRPGMLEAGEKVPFPTVNSIPPKLEEAQKPSNPTVYSRVLQLYNPAIHKVGDRVLVQKGKRLVEAVVPELDADGHPVPP